MTIYEVLGRKTEEAENLRQQIGLALDMVRQIKAGMIKPEQIQIVYAEVNEVAAQTAAGL